MTPASPLFESHPGRDWVPLGEICERGGGNIQTGPFGSQLHASDYVEFGVPCVMPQDITEDRVSTAAVARVREADAARLSKYRLRAGDIVYSRRGDVERRALITESEDGWLCGTGCLRVRFGDGVVDPRYASYFLSHPASREWVVRHAVGATMPNLNTSILGALPFLLPPLPEQRRIARILGALDDKIELNRRTNETLEAMARALFRAWFVDFEPVRAKQDGRPLDPLSQKHLHLFPDRLVDTEHGEIPEGWEWGKLGEVADFVRDSVDPGKSPDTVFAHYSLPAFDGGRWPKPERGAEIKSTKGVVPKGCVLLSKLNPRIPRVWLPEADEDLPAIASTEFLVASPRKPFWREWLYLQFLADDFRDFLAGSVTGTSGSHQRVQRDSVLEIPIVIPPDDGVKAFTAIVAPMLRKVGKNLSEARTLAGTRDALLPRLLLGEALPAKSEEN
jgi:type I restriction enzyme S subunit